MDIINIATEDEHLDMVVIFEKSYNEFLKSLPIDKYKLYTKLRSKNKTSNKPIKSQQQSPTNRHLHPIAKGLEINSLPKFQEHKHLTCTIISNQ